METLPLFDIIVLATSYEDFDAWKSRNQSIQDRVMVRFTISHVDVEQPHNLLVVITTAYVIHDTRVFGRVDRLIGGGHTVHFDHDQYHLNSSRPYGVPRLMDNTK